MPERSGGAGLRGLLARLRGGARAPGSSPDDTDPTLEMAPERIGPYRVVDKLGRGGMGIVFSALDDRLGRSVAIKIIRRRGGDDSAVKRFWREARAAAAVNHPNICQIYEVGEHEGQLYIAMEQLEGESLGDRLDRGPLPAREAVPVGLGILSALEALHARGLLHRDLKPSNVFLTRHGVKLLDFGLARPLEKTAEAEEDPAELTQPGMLVGTPRYMAPEQIRGEELGPAVDLFATGALLFQMLAGRPAFDGGGLAEILNSVLHEQPPALAGSPHVTAVDRVIRRALEKAPHRRYPSARAMASDLRGIALGNDVQAPVLALKRIVVLPFRCLRPDPDIDFLSYGLADGVSTSLTAFRSLVVRSTAAAARLAGEPVDLGRIASEVDVDLVVTGTLLRAGDQLRVAVQLVEGRSGTLVGSHTVQPEMGDVIRLQDDVTRSIVAFLSPTLSVEATEAHRPVAAKPRAYELYLRALEAARDYSRLVEARDLFVRSTEEDPSFAPAWAQLGRCHRVIGKYLGDREENTGKAEEAFARALEVDPELPIAHKYLAHLEAETGRATEAMTRLLQVARANRNDAAVFAGLVHSCRYAGLLEASVAAHEESRRLDPKLPTSIPWTLLARVEYERLCVLDQEDSTEFDAEPRMLALALMGRIDEARRLLGEHEAPEAPRVLRTVTGWVRPFLDQDPEAVQGAVEEGLATFFDPEALFLYSLVLFRTGRVERGLELLEGAVGAGYTAVHAMAEEPSFDPVRGAPRFETLREQASARRAVALAAYRSAGGERLLGI
jgi:serine/threonine protein kinase/tetratricopeptide (TPR) repeat protein